MTKTKFKIGDRVTRLSDVFDDKSTRLFGRISEVYQRRTVFGFYPELYKVIWDDGKEQFGFLPHGLDKV